MPDPHVYPDPQLAPLSLPAAVGLPAPTFTPIEQLAAPDPSTPFIPKTMFIRAATSGAAASGPTVPSFFLRADTGDAVLLNNLTQVIYRQPGTNLADYVADAVVTAESNNVFRITVTFNDVAGNYAWQLGIWNNDAGAAREFTWVVSATLANTAQPWIHVGPTLLSWDVLINGVKSDSVTISNKGTGAFTVSGVTPALPAQFVLGALPGVLNPNTSAPLTVTFNAPAAPPAPDGTVTANALVSITPADNTAGTGVGHNRQLSVSATTQALEVMLLLDTSGSMSWDPLGTVLPVPSNMSRWHELVDAVNVQFLPLLGFFGNGRGKFGIARFPATNPALPATYDLQAPVAIPDPAGMAAAEAAVAGVTPVGGTPMGDGIDHVVAPATSYFATDALSINANRRWLLLMTDGAHNSGTHNPLEFIPPSAGGTAPAGSSLSDKKIKMFAVGYGVIGYSDVNATLLQQLVAGSYPVGEIRRPDDDGVTATQVASAFRDAIKAGITPGSSPGDPPAVFHAGQAEARHFALMTRYDRRSAFVLSWNTPDPRRMRLELITPTCDLITPETAGRGPFRDIEFRGGDRSNMYMVGADFLRNTADPTRPRYGTWTLRVLSPQLADSRRGLEHYDYDIIVDSDLSMAVKLDRAAYHAGDPIRVSARVLAAGTPVKGATVVLSTTARQQSESNWLADLKVSPDFLRRAQEMVRADSSPILIKATAARLAGMKFPGGSHETNLAMTDPSGVGTYQATVADTSTPEMYTFYVIATGVTDDGVAFRREAKVATNVLIQPDPAHTQLDLKFRDAGLVDVRIAPRDRFDNVLLLDPATAGNFQLNVTDAAFAGPLINNVDGTYSRPLRYDPARTPVVSALFNGRPIKRVVLPPIRNLRWVDRVAAFQPGAEAARGANQHTRATDVLGDIFQKPADAFVSLGGAGRLIVAVNNAAIVAAGEDDVTVFVPLDVDASAYRVEVFVPRKLSAGPFGWVTIGTSTGVTQSFSLRSASIRSAVAIRITDLSKRTRGPDLRPLPTPGASVRGVGVLKVTDQIPGGLALLLRFLERPEE